jgi:protein-S-isoprenylcysteine O-methyltransferase Ste14
VRSSALVAAQFALIVALVATTEPLATPVANAIAFALVIAGTFVGFGALASNRPGNFNVRPELKDSARLVTEGIYAHVRHPMYLSVLLLMAAALAADPRLWRIALWAALLAVLIAKARREEGYLRARFPQYAEYMQRTARLLPRIY